MKEIEVSDELYADLKKHAKVFDRSLIDQIKHWSRIGNIVEENPGVSYNQIVQALLKAEESNKERGANASHKTS